MHWYPVCFEKYYYCRDRNIISSAVPPPSYPTSQLPHPLISNITCFCLLLFLIHYPYQIPRSIKVVYGTRNSRYEKMVRTPPPPPPSLPRHSSSTHPCYSLPKSTLSPRCSVLAALSLLLCPYYSPLSLLSPHQHSPLTALPSRCYPLINTLLLLLCPYCSALTALPSRCSPLIKTLPLLLCPYCSPLTALSSLLCLYRQRTSSCSSYAPSIGHRSCRGHRTGGRPRDRTRRCASDSNIPRASQCHGFDRETGSAEAIWSTSWHEGEFSTTVVGARFCDWSTYHWVTHIPSHSKPLITQSFIAHHLIAPYSSVSNDTPSHSTTLLDQCFHHTVYIIS